jgi:TRAP-type transport system periplasmic protein
MRRLPLALVLVLAATSRADELKIATLAPRGSAWADIMEDGAARLAAATAGRVTLRYYFGGQQGDEKDVVRKMKLGQLDGAALTAVGLGLIQPDILVLQLPYLFRSDRQVDRVRAELAPDFERELDAAGYVLVGWGDVGWVKTYSTVPIDTPQAFLSVKMWQLADDPISRELFQLLGVNGVPLGIGEVLPALQTGAVQAVFGPPLAVIALQWHTKIRFMTDRPSNYAVGALVIRKAAFARLSAADQKLFLDGSHETSARLTASVRRDNERAERALLKLGVKVIHVPDVAQAALVDAGQKVQQRLAGKLYPPELLDKVLKTIAATPE